MLDTVLNILTLVLALSCCWMAYGIYHITHAKAVLALLVAFICSAFIRASVLVDLPYVSAHTRPLTVVTFLLFAIAMASLYRALSGLYRREVAQNMRETEQDVREAQQDARQEEQDQK